MLYVFFRKTNDYDYAYFAVIVMVLFGWIWNDGECIVALAEKKIIDKKYVAGKFSTMNPSIFMYHGNVYLHAITLFIINLLVIYNIIIMMHIYGVNVWIIYGTCTVTYLAVVYCIIWHFNSWSTQNDIKNEMLYYV
jgi:hypothetical protein